MFLFESDDVPALPLVGPSFCTRCCHCREFSLFAQLGALLDAGLVFRIEFFRLLRRAASLAQCQHFDVPLKTATLNLKMIPDTHTSSRLNPLIIEVHLAAGDRFTCQRTRFEKARGPQPLIDSDRSVHSHFTHNTGGHQKSP